MSALCRESDCTRPLHCRGLCKLHYERWRTGPQFERRPNVIQPRTLPYSERLPILRAEAESLRSSLRISSSGCWEWTGQDDGHGYGAYHFRNDKWKAHRLFYEAYIGEATGLYVCHRCDNPPCVRPEHLFLGTQADNMRDCSTKGRVKAPLTQKGERHHFATVSDEQIREAVALYRAGGMSQKAVAAKYGVRQATFWRWLQGHTRRGAA